MENREIKLSFEKCKICGSSVETLTKKTVDGLMLAKCNNCKLLFVKEIPVSRLWAVDDHDKTINYYSNIAGEKAKFIYALGKIKGLLQSKDKSSYSEFRILDIGCGDGSFLSMCKNEGFDVYGVELRESCVDLCRKNGIENVFRKDISEIDGQFDLITLFDVAEHLEELIPFFVQIRRLLKPEGYLYIETPRQSILDFYINLLGLFSSIRNNRVSREHVQLFSDKSLRILMSKTYFDIVDFESKCSLSWKNKRQYIKNLGVKSEIMTAFFEHTSNLFIKLRIFGNNKAIIIAQNTGHSQLEQGIPQG